MKPADLQSPNLRVVDAPRVASANIKFAWGRYHKIADELLPLWQRHWQEIALDKEQLPLRPHFQTYYGLEVVNALRILAARDARTRELVGYCFNLLGPHLHYSLPHAHTEMFWLAPEYRRGWNGVHMMAANRRGLKQLGIKLHTINFKIGFEDGRVGKVFQRLGYTPTDITMRAFL